MNVFECLRCIEEQANRLFAGLPGRPARPACRQCRLDGVSRLLGSDLDLRQALQVQPGMNVEIAGSSGLRLIICLRIMCLSPPSHLGQALRENSNNPPPFIRYTRRIAYASFRFVPGGAQGKVLEGSGHWPRSLHPGRALPSLASVPVPDFTHVGMCPPYNGSASFGPENPD